MDHRHLRFRTVLIGASALALVLSGCSAAAEQSTENPKSLDFDQLATSTPAGAGAIDDLKWNLPFEPSNIDWTRPYNWAEPTVVANMCEGLFRYEPDFTVKPNLATGVATPDDLTYVIALRKGVKFWDGNAMTADDVVASLKRNEDPEVGSVFGKYFDNVESITASGRVEVTVKMTRPDATFIQAMSSAAGAVGEASYLDKVGNQYGSPQGGAMCTGPFKFEEWKPGVSITLSKNDDYWDSSRAPKAEKITFSFVSDESTAVNSLLSGEMDGAYFYTPPPGLSKLQQDPNGSVFLGRSMTFFSLVATAQDGVFADPRVRSALLKSLDRSAIAKTVFQGTALPARALTGPAYWGYAKDTFAQAYEALPEPKADIEGASKLIKEAGAEGKTVTIAASGSSTVHSQLASLIEASGEAIGLKVDIKIVPVDKFGDLYNDAKAREGIDGFLTDWYGQIADPIDIYDLFAVEGGYNYINFMDEADRLSKALSTLDDAERAKLVTEAQVGVTENTPWLPLVDETNILYMNKKISGAVASFAFVSTPWAATIGAVEQ